jgi:hypothetical protein
MTYNPANTPNPALNLNQAPPIRLSKNSIFLIALTVLFFIFFFTRQETVV